MAWFYLFVAGSLEIFWAYSLKRSAGFTLLIPSVLTVVLMIASFWMLALALRELPLGTAYAIWTGIGVIGSFVLGIVLLGESLSLARVVAALLILSGLVLMKISSA